MKVFNDANIYYTKHDLDDFMAMGLKKLDVVQLLKIFMGFFPTSAPRTTIRVNHFLQHFELESNALCHKILKIESPRRGYALTFRQFVIYMWEFLTMSVQEIHSFSFDLLNISGSGRLEMPEVARIATHFLPNPHSCSQQKEMIARILVSEDSNKSMNKHEFLTMVQKYPVLVFPVFAVQEKLRTVILGESFWLGKESAAIQLKKMPHVIDMLTYGTESRPYTLISTAGGNSRMKYDLSQQQIGNKATSSVGVGFNELQYDLTTDYSITAKADMLRPSVESKGSSKDKNNDKYECKDDDVSGRNNFPPIIPSLVSSAVSAVGGDSECMFNKNDSATNGASNGTESIGGDSAVDGSNDSAESACNTFSAENIGNGNQCQHLHNYHQHHENYKLYDQQP